MHNTEEGLFETLSKKFKPQYNETKKSLQFHKLVRKHNKNTERMDGQRQTSNSSYGMQLSSGEQLKVQFIHGLNEHGLMVEIIKELIKTEENKDVTRNEILQWTR